MTVQPTGRRLLLDTVVAVLLFAAMVVEAQLRSDRDTTLNVPGLVAMVAVVLPTFARHRHPGWGLAASMVALYVTLLFVDVHDTAPFSAMLCGYCLALTVDRRRSIIAALLLVPAVVALVVLFIGSPSELWTELPKNLLYVAVPLLLGMTVRNRRAYLAALLDRAETAERTREDEAARRVSEERLRIAQDLHDAVAHAMVAINVQAGVGLHLVDRDPARAHQTLQDIKQVSGAALDDLRATLGVLRSGEQDVAPTTPGQGLADLDELVTGLRSAGVAVQLDVDPSALGVAAGIGSTGYRIVQEALTNVVRHAGGATVRVDVARDDGHVVIEVDDDGPGHEPQSAPVGTGNGVRGMQERAAAVGGTLDAGPHCDGWRVRAVLPVGGAVL